MQVLEEIRVYDTYHLPAYHRLAEVRGEGRAAMLVYREHNVTIAFPMLIRPIDTPISGGPGHGYNDVTSVYGCPGPVASTRDISADTKERFAAALDEFLRHNHVVSAFTRLSPVLENAHILRACGETVDMGPTVSVDLTLPRDVQYARYRRSHRQDISQLKDMGFTCIEAGKEALDGFLRAYTETMDRNGAEEYYYFDRSYFEYLLDEMPRYAHLFVVRDRTRVVSGMIALSCNGIVQGHLGGTLNDYVRLAPMKLAYDGVRSWANDIGARLFHMGGGIAGKNDSLLQYKRGFGKQEHMYSVWRYYVDYDMCDRLFREACHVCGIVPDEPYFPPYRNPVFRNGHSCGPTS